MTKHNLTTYEKILNFNKVLSWVHSLRFRETVNILKTFGKRKIRILEIGCAHAQLFEVLNKQFDIDYYAIEQDSGFYEEALKRYGHEPNFHIINRDAADPACYQLFPKPDVVVCLETLEHVEQGDVGKIIAAISTSGAAIFLCSVPVEIGPAVIYKNLASFFFRYHRHKDYSWRETFWAAMYRLDKLPPHNRQHKGFDWRQLVKQIKEKMLMTNIKCLPFKILTSPFANTIYITAVIAPLN